MAYWHCPRRIRSRFYESVRCPSVHLSQHGPTAGGLLLWAHAGTAGRTSIDCCSGGCGQCHVVSVRSSRTQTCRIWPGSERSGSSLSLDYLCNEMAARGVGRQACSDGAEYPRPLVSHRRAETYAGRGRSPVLPSGESRVPPPSPLSHLHLLLDRRPATAAPADQQPLCDWEGNRRS